MKYVTEFRDPRRAKLLLDELARTITKPWVVMEVCGGQTHAIMRHGLPGLLPKELEIVHGPGCPVCVTPLGIIDRAHYIARQPGVILTSYGDMLRVPGSNGDLLKLRAAGADVRIVYSPLDALALARANPDRQVVFFAVGFETTAPATAMAVHLAQKEKLANISFLCAHVLVPPSIASIMQSPGNRVQAYLGPGHVCTITGAREYEALARNFRVPIVITGFEPIDILDGLLRVVRQLESGRAEVENPYARVVPREGNPEALRLLDDVFEVVNRNWRGVGLIPKSGYRLRHPYRALDAEHRWDAAHVDAEEPSACISGLVLKGQKKPTECPAFGRECTPATPLGATMVSSEGACAAYFKYAARAGAGG